MGEAWAVGGTAAIATGGVVAVRHSGSRRTSATKPRLAHRAMGSRIIRETSCAYPECQGVNGVAPAMKGSCRRHAEEEGIMQQPQGFWETTLGMTLTLWLCTLPRVMLIVLPQAFTMPGMHSERPREIEAVSTHAGSYEGRVHLATPGRWEVIVKVMRPGHPATEAVFYLHVEPT